MEHSKDQRSPQQQRPSDRPPAEPEVVDHQDHIDLTSLQAEYLVPRSRLYGAPTAKYVPQLAPKIRPSAVLRPSVSAGGSASSSKAAAPSRSVVQTSDPVLQRRFRSLVFLWDNQVHLRHRHQTGRFLIL